MDPRGAAGRSWRRRCSPRSLTTEQSRRSTCPRCARSAAAGTASAALEQAVAKRLDCVVGQGYGITEASPLVASQPVRGPVTMRAGSVEAARGRHRGRGRRPAHRATLPRARTTSCGARSQLMAGYRDDPAATPRRSTPTAELHTGDLGHIDEDGSVFLVDRLKELIKVRGSQVPRRARGRATHPPGVADAAVIGVPDERDGERPKAFWCRAALDREQLSAYVAERVAPYKRLGAIEEIDELPDAGRQAPAPGAGRARAPSGARMCAGADDHDGRRPTRLDPWPP